MSRRNAKNELILQEAAARLKTASDEVDRCQAAIATAVAVFKAQSENYDALERALAPKSRAKSTPAQPAPAAAPRSPRKKSEPKSVPNIADAKANVSDASKPASELCVHCNQDADGQDHFYPSPNYHEFEAKAVA